MTRVLRIVGMIVVACLIAANCGGSSPQSSSSAAALVDIGSGLHGIDGLRATVYASGLTHAAAFAFDAQARLWVATAAYSDDGTDGVYLVSTLVAAPVEVIHGLHTPLGLLWYRGSLYVASKERVEAYSGLHGSTFATKRTVVTFPAGVGEVNNLAVSPEGKLLVGISTPCDHCAPTSKYSGAIVSFSPAGGALTLYASGIRAPVGLTYFPGTSDLFVSMNYRDDLGAKTVGDALAVVAPGTTWKNPACYGQGGTACTGVPAATATLDRHAAASEVAIVTGQLGATIGTSAIVAEWSLGKVQRVALTKSGSTYTGVVTPFLTGITNPVAVTLAPDGALIVGDWTTGTIYRVVAQ